jgi:hypothetical protein
VNRGRKTNKGQTYEDTGKEEGQKNQGLVTKEIEKLLSTEHDVLHVERKDFGQSETEGNTDSQSKSEATAPRKKTGEQTRGE